MSVWWGMAGRVQAQEESAHLQKEAGHPRHWSELMTSRAQSLQEAREAFDTHFQTHERGRSVGVKPFERWAWWAEKQGVGMDPVPIGKWWQEAQEVWSSQNAPTTTNDTWRPWGPSEVPIHGGAGRINRIRVSPTNDSVWYACAPSGGLWVTFDEGGTWQVLGADILAPLGATDVWVDPQDENHLWLATGDGNGSDTYSVGVLETWDGGATWATLPLAFEPEQGRRIHALVVHPTNHAVRWAATDIGILGTSDAGATFDVVLPGMVRDVRWVGETEAVAVLENVGVMRTVDSGTTWNAVSLPATENSLGRIQLASEPWGVRNDGLVGRDTLYAVGAHYFQQNFLAVWQSVDGGQTWVATATRAEGPNLLGYTVNGADNAGQAFWDLCVEVNPLNANHVLVGGINVWESLDGGVSWACEVHWQGAFDSKPTHADQHGFTFLPGGDVLLANDGGVFRWSDIAVSDLSAGLMIAQGYHVTTLPGTAGTWMVGTQDNGTVLRTPEVASRILDGDGFQCFFDPDVPGRLYASAYYGLLYRSDDGGRTMSNIATYFYGAGPNELGAWETPFQLHPGVPGRVVMAKKSVHHSDDGGATWTSTGGIGTARSTALALSGSHPDAMLVAKHGTLFFRPDASTPFQEVSGLPGHKIGAVAFEDDLLGTWWVTFETYDAGAQVWRTEDAGATWTTCSQGLPELPVHALLERADGTLLCGSDVGVHAWSEEAQSWSQLATGLPLVPVVDLHEHPETHETIACTYGRGVWALSHADRPTVDIAVNHIEATSTQCLKVLQGVPHATNVGTQTLSAATVRVVATQGAAVIEQEVETVFDTPWVPGETRPLSAFSLEVPVAGMAVLDVIPLGVSEGATGLPARDTLWASGLGHVVELQWWGDCENVDMRWAVSSDWAGTSETVAWSLPLAPLDTVSSAMCLAEGCHVLRFDDKGGDGFSGNDCGETGGFRLFGPFGDVIHEEVGTDFGSVMEVAFCVEVPWCYADYNGDGFRSVDDLLVLLSDFGCAGACASDNNADDLVSVTDLMNMLSVFGSGCDE